MSKSVSQALILSQAPFPKASGAPLLVCYQTSLCSCICQAPLQHLRQNEFSLLPSAVLSTYFHNNLHSPGCSWRWKLRPSAHGCQRQRQVLAGDLALPSGPLPTSVRGYCSAPRGLSFQMKILRTPAGHLGDGGRLPRGWSWTITSETCVTQTDLWRVILLLSHVTTFHQHGPGKGPDDEAHPPVSLGARTLQSHWSRAGVTPAAAGEVSPTWATLRCH
ncbi:uncharacterized protein LOC116866560 [Lontra canadensis]|uniref:uncharacterized protein LOC116866560 n=1 Tax=Lontra canadensis TaxID=76717 RepID=UPI0013F37C68|nr:uncharacterized protein LOC116866560 [Lontra canadensis]